MTTTTGTDTHEDTDTMPGQPHRPRRQFSLRAMLLGVVIAGALVVLGYLIGSITDSGGDTSAASAADGYAQGSATAAAVGASIGDGPPALTGPVAMGARIADALPPGARFGDLDAVAATALPAGHVLNHDDIDAPASPSGAAFTVAVRSDQYPTSALRYHQPVAIIGAAATDYRGLLLGLQPTADGGAILTVTTDGLAVVTDTLAHADTIHLVGLRG